ncbi:hypothetical protein TNCV_1222251 [Trichonephila clavipes]|nr:hypothetical protein TNCV_1222251 [Trichonephila clavipes]
MLKLPASIPAERPKSVNAFGLVIPPNFPYFNLPWKVHFVKSAHNIEDGGLRPRQRSCAPMNHSTVVLSFSRDSVTTARLVTYNVHLDIGAHGARDETS